MKYLEHYNKYQNPLGNMPIEEQVQNWIKYLNENYSISVYRNMKSIEVFGKQQFLSEPYLTKSSLKEKLFLEIKYRSEEEGSVIHYPSLRKAIKMWIDQNSSIKENLNTNFDIDFAMWQIVEEFPIEKVKQMLDKEVFEWIGDKEQDWYKKNSNGEAEDIIINYLIDWYQRKNPSTDVESVEPLLKNKIQEKYIFLNTVQNKKNESL
jgi:hypothetical protein